MEKMRIELQLQKIKVKFVAINDITASTPADQKGLLDKCSFPLFQDTDTVQAWKHHSGNKDDIYVFDADGKLSSYNKALGPPSFDLSSQEGYDNLKNAILKAVK